MQHAYTEAMLSLHHAGKQKGAEMKVRIAGDELLAELSQLFETRKGSLSTKEPLLKQFWVALAQCTSANESACEDVIASEALLFTLLRKHCFCYDCGSLEY